MHFALITTGSRGDVQPYIALALGLIQHGHKVTLSAPENFKDFVESFRLDFHPTPSNTEKVIKSPEGKALLKNGSTIALLKFFRKEGNKTRIPVRQSIFDSCKDADVILTSYITTYAVSVIAEKLQKKWAILNLNPPLLKTKEMPAMGFDFFNSSFFNRLSYSFVHFMEWQINKRDVRNYRNDLGLPPLKKSLNDFILEKKVLIMHAISPHLLKRPEDWEPHHLLTGFMFPSPQVDAIPASDRIPDGLREWMNSGDKPVYIGFGSIPFPDEQLLLYVIEKLLETGKRIILCTGWSEIAKVKYQANLFVVKAISHDWILPKCKVAVIHGGIGTLTAALKAGTPPVVVSIFADQPFWGKVVSQRKIGTHIPWKKLNSESLYKAIDTCCTKEYAVNVGEIGAKLKSEDGVSNTVQILEKSFL